MPSTNSTRDIEFNPPPPKKIKIKTPCQSLSKKKKREREVMEMTQHIIVGHINIYLSIPIICQNDWFFNSNHFLINHVKRTKLSLSLSPATELNTLKLPTLQRTTQHA